MGRDRVSVGHLRRYQLLVSCLESGFPLQESAGVGGDWGRGGALLASRICISLTQSESECQIVTRSEKIKRNVARKSENE